MDRQDLDMETLIDTSRPHVPCMYDYYLGGHYNSAIDRQAAQRAIDAAPIIPMIARENRRFLRRSVRFMAEQGIKQFLDIGSGLPTVGNTHEIAQEIQPEARVVYVDHEPVVKILGEAILAKDERTSVVIESALNPERILQHADVQRLLDFSQPVSLLMYSVLHFISDEQLQDVLTAFYGKLPSGSYIAASHHFTPPSEGLPPDNHGARVTQDEYKKAATTVYTRSKDYVSSNIFARDGWKLVEPGLVMVPEWRPDDRDKSEEGTVKCFMIGAVATKL